MSAIFISYRRGDDAGEAGRIFDRLKRRFGKRVFMDVEGGIGPGDPFPEVLARRLLGCGAAVIVIGPRWLNATDANGARRLDDPKDWVRLEIATVLGSGAEVIPVLVNGATMPAAHELPADIAALASRQAVELRGSSWDFEVGRLIHTLEGVVPGGRLRRWRVPAALATLAAAAVAAWSLFGPAPGPAATAALEVALYTIEADERGAVFAARLFDSPDGVIDDRVYGIVVDWLADTLGVEPSPGANGARVVVAVPADLAARSFRVERMPDGPVTVNLWELSGGGKLRLPVTEASLRTRTQPFVLEISLPGWGSNVIDVQPGVALLDTIAFAPAGGTVRIGIEDIEDDAAIALGLTRVIAERAGFTALSPAALEAMRRTLAEARQQILENPMMQMTIRETLGVDYLLAASVVRS